MNAFSVIDANVDAVLLQQMVATSYCFHFWYNKHPGAHIPTLR